MRKQRVSQFKLCFNYNFVPSFLIPRKWVNYYHPSYFTISCSENVTQYFKEVFPSNVCALKNALNYIRRYWSLRFRSLVLDVAVIGLCEHWAFFLICNSFFSNLSRQANYLLQNTLLFLIYAKKKQFYDSNLKDLLHMGVITFNRISFVPAKIYKIYFMILLVLF